jgi:hypothetical protein
VESLGFLGDLAMERIWYERLAMGRVCGSAPALTRAATLLCIFAVSALLCGLLAEDEIVRG